MWGDSRSVTPPPVASPSDLVAPLGPLAQQHPAFASDVPANASQREPDPYEELAVPADGPASAEAAPRRRNSRPATRPAAESLAGAEEPPSPGLAPPGPAHNEPAPLDLTSSAFASPTTSHPALHFHGLSDAEIPAWPVGERRSFARQARTPLPAVLQEVVAFDLAQVDPGEPASQPVASGQAPEPTVTPLGGTGTSTAAGRGPGTGKKPGIVHRYGSAIAIVVLFVVAGGAAAGVAAFRGPVSQPGLATSPRYLAAANKVVLRAGDFPPPWHISNNGITASSYGLGSAFVRPAIVHSWLAAHSACATVIDAVSAAMLPPEGSETAVASTQAAAANPSGSSWQTVDTVVFRSSAAQARTDLTRLRSLIAEPSARACVSRFWTAALLAELPPGSQVAMTVSQPPIPVLPGNPSVWAMAMSGTSAVGHIALPIRFEVTSFAVGRAQVSFSSSSKVAPLPSSLNEGLLVTLATRAEKQAA